MKTPAILPAFLAAFALILPLTAADHANEKTEAGPNGGRLLKALEPHAEFFITADRKVQITFLDENNQPVAPDAQVVTVTAGDRVKPTKLTFIKSGNVLLSDIALPAGNDFPTVVQIKVSPKAKTVTEKFNLDLSTCPECKLGEYACICDH